MLFAELRFKERRSHNANGLNYGNTFLVRPRLNGPVGVRIKVYGRPFG
jgi:hypothetical protein